MALPIAGPPRVLEVRREPRVATLQGTEGVAALIVVQPGFGSGQGHSGLSDGVPNQCALSDRVYSVELPECNAFTTCHERDVSRLRPCEC